MHPCARWASTSEGRSPTPSSSRMGRSASAKVPTSSRQHESVVAAAQAAGAVGVERFTHGTTMATNALLERRGARTALVTNEGFEHVLHLRRQTTSPPLPALHRASASARPARALRRRSGTNGVVGPAGSARPRHAARRATPRRSRSRSSSRSATTSPSARSPPSCGDAIRPRTLSPRTRSPRSSASTSVPRRRLWTHISDPCSRATSSRSRGCAALRISPSRL